MSRVLRNFRRFSDILNDNVPLIQSPRSGALLLHRGRFHCAKRTFTLHSLQRSEFHRRSHASLEASDGIRQSPRGESDTDPTFGESGTQLRLNWEAKNRR